MRKKTVLIHSNFSRAFTGFGKHKKNIMLHLAKTGKYNLVELANGVAQNDDQLDKLPWTCEAGLPDVSSIQNLSNKDKNDVAYGLYTIDDVVKKHKPDVYIGIEDIWAFDKIVFKPWFKEINNVIWTTLDSLPILPTAINYSPLIKNYFVWATFAQKALNDLGFDNVKTLHGTLNTEDFYRLDSSKRQELRGKFGLTDEFVIGFVFRNQLRKTVPALLEAFVDIKKSIPKAKLLLHTSWSEGWDIGALIREFNINEKDVLTTYYCGKCKKYHVMPFSGKELDCPFCGTERSFDTTNIACGVNESQLNEIYNLMDVYCHPFTSGGQEIPIQEAKLTGLITLVTSYSCGTDYCTSESGGMALDWFPYREFGTQFIKASTKPSSIYESVMKVYNMDSKTKEEMGKVARDYVLDKCSIEAVGKKLEELIDSMPFIEYDDSFFSVHKIPEDYKPDFNAPSIDFVKDAYKNILGEVLGNHNSIARSVAEEIDRGFPKEVFIKNLVSEQEKRSRNALKQDFESLLDSDDKGRRIGVVIPNFETDAFLINALLTDLKNKYSDYNIYVMTREELFPFLEDNLSIHRILKYSEQLSDPFLLEGKGEFEGYFDMAFFPCTTTQQFINHVHNGKDK